MASAVIEGFGTIEFSENDIRKAVNYADTNEERAAMIAIPYVLKRGIVIGEHANHKDRLKHTITFGAEVKINGQTGHMAAVINSRGNHYYVSRIVNPDGSTFVFKKEETARELYRGVRKNASLANTTSAVPKDSIPQKSDLSTEKSKYVASLQQRLHLR